MVAPPDDGPWIRPKDVEVFEDKYSDNKLCIKLAFLYSNIQR
jgi:hypothetical protein